MARHALLTRQVLDAMVGVVTPKLHAWLKSCNRRQPARFYLRVVGVRSTAKIACRTILERFEREGPHIELCLAIGDRLELKHESRKTEDPKAWNRRLTRLATVVGWRRASWTKQKADGWTHVVKLRLGLILTNLIAEWTAMIEIVPDPKKGIWDRSRVNVVRGTDELVTWLREKEELYRARDEWHGPRPELPPRWDKDNCKGLIRGDRGRHFKGSVDLPQVFGGLNRQQAVTWRLNRRVLQVLEEAFDSGAGIASLPSGQRPELDRWVDKRTWARHQNTVYEWLTRRKLVGRVLAMSAGLEGFFHFRWSCDFRGRAYPKAFTISPQGSDLGRAVIEFARGEPIGFGGHLYLAHHGANMWGLRGTYEHREGWAYENTARICESARAPLDYTWWAGAADPWRFLAFCFEWQGYQQHGQMHVTHLPCQIDGTCNGFQIAALALRDRELAELVNCESRSGPVDLYQLVADDVARSCISGWGPEWLDLLGGRVDRSVVKPAAIALAFGAGNWAAGAAVQDWFWRQPWHRPFGGHVAKPCWWLADQVGKSIAVRASAFTRLSSWAREVANQVSAKGEDIEWLTPVGFPVACRYRGIQRLQVKASRHPRIELRYTEETDKRDLAKAARTIVPNLIHSLDAAAMIATVNRCDFDVYSVHDCVGALAPRMDRLHWAVRDAYSAIFSRDVLLDFAVQTGIDRVPAVATGGFDPALVRHSNYFFT